MNDFHWLLIFMLTSQRKCHVRKNNDSNELRFLPVNFGLFLFSKISHKKKSIGNNNKQQQQTTKNKKKKCREVVVVVTLIQVMVVIG